jgi:hypothetical protein
MKGSTNATTKVVKTNKKAAVKSVAAAKHKSAKVVRPRTKAAPKRVKRVRGRINAGSGLDQLRFARRPSLAATVRPIRAGSITSYNVEKLIEFVLAIAATAILTFLQPLVGLGFALGVAFMGIRAWGDGRYGR